MAFVGPESDSITEGGFVGPDPEVDEQKPKGFLSRLKASFTPGWESLANAAQKAKEAFTKPFKARELLHPLVPIVERGAPAYAAVTAPLRGPAAEIGRTVTEQVSKLPGGTTFPPSPEVLTEASPILGKTVGLLAEGIAQPESVLAEGAFALAPRLGKAAGLIKKTIQAVDEVKPKGLLSRKEEILEGLAQIEKAKETIASGQAKPLFQTLQANELAPSVEQASAQFGKETARLIELEKDLKSFIPKGQESVKLAKIVPKSKRTAYAKAVEYDKLNELVHGKKKPLTALYGTIKSVESGHPLPPKLAVQLTSRSEITEETVVALLKKERQLRAELQTLKPIDEMPVEIFKQVKTLPTTRDWQDPKAFFDKQAIEGKPLFKKLYSEGEANLTKYLEVMDQKAEQLNGLMQKYGIKQKDMNLIRQYAEGLIDAPVGREAAFKGFVAEGDKLFEEGFQVANRARQKAGLPPITKISGKYVHHVSNQSDEFLSQFSAQDLYIQNIHPESPTISAAFKREGNMAEAKKAGYGDALFHYLGQAYRADLLGSDASKWQHLARAAKKSGNTSVGQLFADIGDAFSGQMYTKQAQSLAAGFGPKVGAVLKKGTDNLIGNILTGNLHAGLSQFGATVNAVPYLGIRGAANVGVRSAIRAVSNFSKDALRALTGFKNARTTGEELIKLTPEASSPAKQFSQGYKLFVHDPVTKEFAAAQATRGAKVQQAVLNASNEALYESTFNAAFKAARREGRSDVEAAKIADEIAGRVNGAYKNIHRSVMEHRAGSRIIAPLQRNVINAFYRIADDVVRNPEFSALDKIEVAGKLYAGAVMHNLALSTTKGVLTNNPPEVDLADLLPGWRSAEIGFFPVGQAAMAVAKLGTPKGRTKSNVKKAITLGLGAVVPPRIGLSTTATRAILNILPGLKSKPNE